MQFEAELTPKQMLSAGIFGNSYFRIDKRCWLNEIPDEWKLGTTQTLLTPDSGHNQFGVLSGLPLKEWQRKGWIHPDDPCGWFQWYCRYYLGRRHDDDSRQIGRWRNYVRRKGMLRMLVERGRDTARERQSLLQWGYRPGDY